MENNAGLTSTLNAAEKLTRLRQLMQMAGIDYYIVPARDQHNNEYVPKCWQRRQWLSGFDGSAGDVLVTLTTALLWTDSRYFLQAEQQLDRDCFKLMKIQVGCLSMEDWVSQQAPSIRLGVDPKLMSLKQIQRWQQIMADKKGHLILLEKNLIDEMNGSKPDVPANPIELQSESLAGNSLSVKVEWLREKLRAKSIDAHVIVSLDALAWLLNIRGSDIEYNPLVIGYGIVTQQQVMLFVNPLSLDEKVSQYLSQNKVDIYPYTLFENKLQQLSAEKILLDPVMTNGWVAQQLKPSQIVLEPSLIPKMQAIKTLAEQQGMRQAHHEDALALIQFFYWLETALQQEMEITEVMAADQLQQFRLQQPHCRGLSFATISAFGEHGAIVHYQPSKQTAKRIDHNNLYLLDSGGQYVNGTTDVTRTLHLGQPTSEQKYHYTLVLKGHLALRHAIFPKGTCGYQLDSLARQYLWAAGLDYGHGTGHGVGCYLCVHEGPQSISPVANLTVLEPGMMVSNEPGVYFPGKYGIRIENICQVVEHSERSNTFSDLTWVPYARNLIEIPLLSTQEIQWINDYHHMINQELAPKLPSAEQVWLAQATAPLVKSRNLNQDTIASSPM